MKFKHVKEFVIKVNYLDLEKFIVETTGHAYNMIPENEMNNDTIYRYDIDGDLRDYQESEWETFKKEGGRASLIDILEGLCKEGHIDKGIYYVSVSW